MQSRLLLGKSPKAVGRVTHPTRMPPLLFALSVEHRALLEDRGDDVIVNLRPDTDEETEYVRFDRPRVVRILERITADLDQLAQGSDTQHDGDPTTQHRKRLAEPPPPTRRLSTKEARDSLRAELKLPPK